MNSDFNIDYFENYLSELYTPLSTIKLLSNLIFEKAAIGISLKLTVNNAKKCSSWSLPLKQSPKISSIQDKLKLILYYNFCPKKRPCRVVQSYKNCPCGRFLLCCVFVCLLCFQLIRVVKSCLIVSLTFIIVAHIKCNKYTYQ